MYNVLQKLLILAQAWKQEILTVLKARRVPGTVLSISHVSSRLISTTPPVIIAISQLRKQRHREGRQLAQSYTASKWQSRFNSKLSESRLCAFDRYSKTELEVQVKTEFSMGMLEPEEHHLCRMGIKSTYPICTAKRKPKFCPKPDTGIFCFDVALGKFCPQVRATGYGTKERKVVCAQQKPWNHSIQERVLNSHCVTQGWGINVKTIPQAHFWPPPKRCLQWKARLPEDELKSTKGNKLPWQTVSKQIHNNSDTCAIWKRF